jgi:protein TonB
MSLTAAATSGLIHALAALALVWSLPPRPIETQSRAIDVTLEPLTPPPVIEASDFPPPPSLPQEAAEPQPPPEVAQTKLEDALPPVDEPPPFSTRELAARTPTAPPRPKPAPPTVQRPPVQPANIARESERRAAQEDYLLQVIQKLSRYRYYPKSREESEHGVVVTRVTVARDGRVLDVELARSSGFPTLDRGVMDTIRQASPFAPLPVEVADSQMSFIVPVSYNRER